MNSIDRGKNAKRNIYISLLCQFVTIICGLITPRFMLKAFGSEVNGAITSINTFLGYIMLLEGGIGGVARASLYKPLAQNDEIRTSEIMTEMKVFFRRVGYVFTIYVLLIACLFKSISHTNALDWSTSFLLVLIISGSTFAQYFIGISNVVLITASQRQYINNLINLVGTILNAIVIVVLTSLGCSIIIVKLVSSIVFVMKPVALWIYVKRNYTIYPRRNYTNVLKDKWTGLGQHIAYFLHSHTDVVVLTVFGNLKEVSVYGVYYMVTNSIQSITTSFSSGMESVFGDMYAKKEYDTLHKTFSIYDTLVSIISIILFGTTAVLIIPFVQLYTIEITDANYIQPLFGLMLVCACWLHCLRAPYHNMIIAAGHFKQTNAASYGEAIINILTSVLLVIHFGLIGVAIGTVAATLYRFVFYAVYLSKNIMGRSIRLWIKREIINIITIAVIYYIGNIVRNWFVIDNFYEWIKAGVVVASVSAAITLFVNIVLYKNECISLGKRLLTIRK